MRDSWNDAPLLTVFVSPPAVCPQCCAAKPIIFRTEANGDGSSTRKCVCRRCSQRFKVVVEIAKFGSDELVPKTLIPVC